MGAPASIVCWVSSALPGLFWTRGFRCPHLAPGAFPRLSDSHLCLAECRCQWILNLQRLATGSQRTQRTQRSQSCLSSPQPHLWQGRTSKDKTMFGGNIVLIGKGPLVRRPRRCSLPWCHRVAAWLRRHTDDGPHNRSTLGGKLCSFEPQCCPVQDDFRDVNTSKLQETHGPTIVFEEKYPSYACFHMFSLPLCQHFSLGTQWRRLVLFMADTVN